MTKWRRSASRTEMEHTLEKGELWLNCGISPGCATKRYHSKRFEGYFNGSF